MTVQRILDQKAAVVGHIAPDASIAELIRSHDFSNEGALVVSSDGETVDGVIATHDVVRGLKSLGTAVLSAPVRDLMTAKVLTCTPDDRMVGIMALMMTKNIGHFPVLKAGKLVGLVSVRDLLRLHLQESLANADAMRRYISGDYGGSSSAT